MTVIKNYNFFASSGREISFLFLTILEKVIFAALFKFILSISLLRVVFPLRGSATMAIFSFFFPSQNQQLLTGFSRFPPSIQELPQSLFPRNCYAEYPPYSPYYILLIALNDVSLRCFIWVENNYILSSALFGYIAFY